MHRGTNVVVEEPDQGPGQMHRTTRTAAVAGEEEEQQHKRLEEHTQPTQRLAGRQAGATRGPHQQLAERKRGCACNSLTMASNDLNRTRELIPGAPLNRPALHLSHTGQGSGTH